ncbi:beta strand repeat-containing protein [Inhella gelatinilytica]|uniref:Cadherin-like domain-containing protein n=1 Tax=Inhella gelatinilytica TaxID=2795030 RepID=A0A931IYT4_9BURK|nr:Ig-like domain-containing protein [Inhella gelatinilytica]MBH9554367.1 cadherin-like domain-containing protein [Inhella gelatinilytica]
MIAASSLLANDTFEGSPTVTAVGSAVGGTVSLSGGNITFTPTANYSGAASFTYTVTSPAGITETATVNVTVTPLPIASVSVSTASVTEDGATNLVYSVSLDRPSSTDTVINLGWSGTATAGTDFTGTRPATITILAGQTTGSTTVTIDPTADSTYEPNETVVATIASGSGYSISGTAGSATGTITNDDAVPTVSSVTSDTQSEGTSLVHTVTLSNASSSSTSFAFTLGGGTATGGGTDYGTPTFSNGVTLVGGNLVVPIGVTSFTITTPTTQDSLVEPNETYNLSVGGVAATGTITNNDAFTVSNVTSDDDDVNENRDASALNDITQAGTITNVASNVVLSVNTATLPSLTSNGTTVTYAWDAGSRTLTASAGAQSVFTVTLNASNTGYTFKQLAALDHAVVAGENHSLSIPISLNARDSLGNLIGSSSFNVTVWDDAPTVSSTPRSFTIANDGVYTETGVLTEATVSNDVTRVSWNTASLPTNLVVDGKTIVWVDLGTGTLEGRTAAGDSASTVLRATVDPNAVNAGGNPQYSVQLVTPVGSDGTIGSISQPTTAYTTIGGGNVNDKTLLFGGYVVNEMKGFTSAGAAGSVNTNNGWIGVGGSPGPGNWFEDGEYLTMDFSYQGTSAPAEVRGVGLKFDGGGNASYSGICTVTAAVNAAGDTVTYSVPFSSAGGVSTVSIPLMNGAIYFTKLEVRQISGSFRMNFDGGGLTYNDYSKDINLSLGYTLTDADGDTASGSFSVLLDAVPASATPAFNAPQEHGLFAVDPGAATVAAPSAAAAPSTGAGSFQVEPSEGEHRHAGSRESVAWLDEASNQVLRLDLADLAAPQETVVAQDAPASGAALDLRDLLQPLDTHAAMAGLPVGPQAVETPLVGQPLTVAAAPVVEVRELTAHELAQTQAALSGGVDAVAEELLRQLKHPVSGV